MRFWWVNQNQTYRQEVPGGYMWSPQRQKNGRRSPYYESMREVAPGDLVFSFSDTFIRAIGIVQSHCYECPRPTEFGTVGAQWDTVGWRVDVAFRAREAPIRPRERMDVLRPLLPDRYAPLRANGDGLQAVYLTELTPQFALALAGLVGKDVLELAQERRMLDVRPEIAALARPPSTILWEEELQRRIQRDEKIEETEKVALIMARRGQGRFKALVRGIEHQCRVTKVDRIEHLIASHSKPWRDSDNEERLDPENGLLLTPTIDHLFDRGFISFDSGGELLISRVADGASLRKMGIDTAGATNVGSFSAGQRRYLEFHREHVFLQRAGR